MFKENLTDKILAYLYERKGEIAFYDVSLKFKEYEKGKVDDCVLSLESYGFVSKSVLGYIGEFEIPEGENKESANMSRCKITKEGIVYHENKINNIGNRRRANIALFISISSLIISVILAVLQA